MLQASLVVRSIRESVSRRLEGLEREISSEMTDEDILRVGGNLDRVSGHLDSLRHQMPAAEWNYLRHTCSSLQSTMTIQESDTDSGDEEEVILQLKRRRGRKTVIDDLTYLIRMNFRI